jgi:hypothetical protein
VTPAIPKMSRQNHSGGRALKGLWPSGIRSVAFCDGFVDKLSTKSAMASFQRSVPHFHRSAKVKFVALLPFFSTCVCVVVVSCSGDLALFRLYPHSTRTLPARLAHVSMRLSCGERARSVRRSANNCR